MIKFHLSQRIGLGIIGFLLVNFAIPAQSPVVSGDLAIWHRVTLTFDGPQCFEGPYEKDSELNNLRTGKDPNPFTHFRMIIDFYQGDRHFMVPGYFAADGNAGETGAEYGNKWRAHFTPDAIGKWNWKAYFRTGNWIAISDEMDAGQATAFDGMSGKFTVKKSKKQAPDFRSKGRLDYVGKHHLQFAGNGEYFLKGGADAPEVFLAYKEIDGTFAHDNKESFMKHWKPHIKDWQLGDPTWGNGKGKGIIGALNYLASKGMNAVSFLTMNVEGDGKNVWPWISDHNFRYFDCSKLDQWEIIFSHAQSKGLFLHFKTQETENDQLLNGGDLGKERMLYYRELIARFGHHLALNWNLGEENTQTDEQRVAMTQYFYHHDPYRHPIVVHTYPNKQNEVYQPLLGNKSYLTGASVQTGFDEVHKSTLQWVETSERFGRPWVVANDEQGGANRGVTPGSDYPGMEGRPDNHREILRHTLWGNLMAGGAGVEYYFGYKYPESDLTCNDWRSRDQMWDYTRYALEFFQDNLPFWEMVNGDHLVNQKEAFCFYKSDEVYTIFLPKADSNTVLDLTTEVEIEYSVQWFNPRTGGNLQAGLVERVISGQLVDIGAPPKDPEQEWVALLKKIN